MRSEPDLKEGLVRLIARLPESYPNKASLDLERKLYRIKAGYAGEQKVDDYLEFLGIPKSSIVLTNIHLPLSPGHSFQIDTLILSRRYVLLLEVKNIRGNLYFETNPHQLIRIYNGEVTKMECPLTQLQLAEENLRRWLAKKGSSIKEVCSQIILANKNAVVKVAPPNAPILFMKRLAILLGQLEKGPIIYSAAELKETSEMIQQNQLEYSPYPLCKYYRIDPNMLKKGQLCSKCNMPMTYKNHKQRFCKGCKVIEPVNYSEAIQDWFMLVSNSISNRECRDFLQLKSKDNAYYVLKSLRLNRKGESVATKYYWPKEIPFKI